MAAVAAKYAHCQVRVPVGYQGQVPLRPEMVAPLDFALRAAELLALDRELDRATLRVTDYRRILLESVLGTPGPGGAFRLDRTPSGAAASAAEGPSLGPRRTQFVANMAQFALETARFRPPWTLATVQDLHAVLLADLGLDEPLGTFRRAPRVARGPHGAPLVENCPPGQIETELRAVLDWVDRYGPMFHPVVPAAVLLERFWAIRPFESGSTTVARAIALAYVQTAGLPNAGLTPIDRSVGESPTTLGRLLLWTQSSGSYAELVDFLLDRLLLAYLSAVERWLRRDGATPDLDEVALRVLSRTRRSPGWFSPEDATRWVGGRSHATVRRHLNDLVARGYLESLGNTRGKRYRARSMPSRPVGVGDTNAAEPIDAPPPDAAEPESTPPSPVERR